MSIWIFKTRILLPLRVEHFTRFFGIRTIARLPGREAEPLKTAQRARF